MNIEQSGQNPDVNTFNIDDDERAEQSPSSGEQGNGDEPGEPIPVPPDTTPPHPVEEPPDSEKPSVGDVDDSPKQIT